MANTRGGVILLGIENDGTVSGIENCMTVKQDFWNTINNRGKVNINRLQNEDVQEVRHSDRRLLAIRIPRASRYQRPVFTGQNPLTGTFRRNAEGDYRCTEQEVARMLADRAEEPIDSRILEHYTLSDLDQPSLQQYRQVFASHKPTHPWLGEDDQGQGGILIEKYQDRFEFSNPGSLLISYEQLLHGNISECRNKTLQTLFTMIGAAEKAGSGVDKIRMGWNSQHWRSPVVREQMRPDRVLWILPMLSLIPEESLDRLKRRFGKRFAMFNPLEIQALVTAELEGYVDNARMRQITNHHATDITLTLQTLVSQGSLTQEGQGRWTRYSLPTQPDSVHKVDDSVHKGGIPEDQWTILLELAKPARENQRFPLEEMEKIILILCKDRWLTRNQLSSRP